MRLINSPEVNGTIVFEVRSTPRGSLRSLGTGSQTVT